MKTITNIRSNTKPIELDDFSSNSFVYVRSNIEETIEIDPVFNTENTIYTYDEVEYTLAEWTKISNESIKNELINTNLAIIELAKMLENTLPEGAMPTAINAIYENMHNKGYIE